MIPWIVLAFLASCSQASRPRGIRAEVTFDQLNMHCWSDFCKSLIRCGEYHQEFASRLLQCTIRALISDVLTGATPFHSSKSTMTTVIARSDETPLVYFTVPPNFPTFIQSFHWSGWLRRARHLRLPQWQVLLWECRTQSLGHSLWQGELILVNLNFLTESNKSGFIYLMGNTYIW